MALLLDASDMRHVLPLADTRGALLDSHQQWAKGLVDVPPRLTADARDGKGWITVGPALMNGSGYMGFKSMNRRPGLGVRYLVMLYEISSGALLALMDANALTTARTAATNAIGTAALARKDARTLGIVGSGVQARAALRELAELRQFDRITVFSPRPESRDDFAAHIREHYQLPVQTAASCEHVAAENDILLLAFRAPTQPVLAAEWLRPGMHVTGLSSVRPEAREVADEVWLRSDVVVLDGLGSVAQSGDGRSITARGIDLGAYPELWEVTTGKASGRTGAEQITLFKSSGDSAQDVAAAAAAYEKAVELGIGRELGDFPEVKPYE